MGRTTSRACGNVAVMQESMKKMQSSLNLSSFIKQPQTNHQTNKKEAKKTPATELGGHSGYAPATAAVLALVERGDEGRPNTCVGVKDPVKTHGQ
jgi:hypothetical protein